MASNNKRKTTMAKLNREAKLRDKRFEKEARRQVRKATPSTGWLAESDHVDVDVDTGQFRSDTDEHTEGA